MTQTKNTFLTLFFIVALSLCSIINAYAQNNAAQPATSDVFESWQRTKDYMTSQGIDPMAISWPLIDPLCLGLRTESDQRQYNKCEYEKARDSVLYANDKSQCSTRVTGAYPDSLLKGRTDTLTETDKSGVTHAYQRAIAPVSTQDLQQQRSGAIVECMQNLGWVNADNWLLGRRNSYCQ